MARQSAVELSQFIQGFYLYSLLSEESLAYYIAYDFINFIHVAFMNYYKKKNNNNSNIFEKYFCIRRGG